MTYKPEEIIPTCYSCGTPMVLREKGGDKFWGCPNWKSCGGKTIPYGKPKQKDKPQTWTSSGANIKTQTGEQMIKEAINGIGKRLDGLATFLKKKLGD